MHDVTLGRPLLSDVLGRLGQTMDASVAVRRLSRLLVPTLADWCIVTLVDDDESRASHRRLRDVGSWHADPGLRDVVAEYAHLRLAALTDASILMRAINSGEIIHVATDAVGALSRVLVPGRARDLIHELRPASFTVAPLKSRGRTLGAITLFSDGDPSSSSPGWVPAVSQTAAAAALALDNARLYRRQRDVATSFQHSLLTAPVRPEHMQVVVRYQPAAEAARVGGDWYDAFVQPDGSTVLVIADVVGHDLEAAVRMAQLRPMLRGIAVVTCSGPAAVLQHLDRAAHTLQVPAVSSAVVARLEQDDRGRADGTVRLRWSNAGHLPPMVLHPDGTAAALGPLGRDPMLGFFPDRPRTDHVTDLQHGATVLLYTDGLVERRSRPLVDGLAELRAALERHADLELEDLCDTLLAELPEGPGDDDIAMVAVRLPTTTVG